ncbi:MAG: acylphosphatase [Lachnospiraceae bacterium]|nr:acylphosphatase [Lachnospiraceae bacterium]
MSVRSENKIVRKRIRVYGRVQGVGFRYLSMTAAAQLNLTGWVQNLADGSVLLEAQGEREMVDRLIPVVENGHWILIERKEEEWIEPVEGERSFGVRR